MHSNPLPETGFCRERQILGDLKASPPVPPIVPVSRSAWWAGIRAGRYPKPIKLGPKTTVWNCRDIRELVERLSAGEGAKV